MLASLQCSSILLVRQSMYLMLKISGVTNQKYSTNLITQIQNQNKVFVIQGKPAQGTKK